MFDLAELPLTLPSYVEHVPRVTLENSAQLLRVNQIKDFEHLVRLKLKCSNSNFRLPPGLRELVWRERKAFIENFLKSLVLIKKTLYKSRLKVPFVDFSVISQSWLVCRI